MYIIQGTWSSDDWQSYLVVAHFTKEVIARIEELQKVVTKAKAYEIADLCVGHYIIDQNQAPEEIRWEAFEDEGYIVEEELPAWAENKLEVGCDKMLVSDTHIHFVGWRGDTMIESQGIEIATMPEVELA